MDNQEQNNVPQGDNNYNSNPQGGNPQGGNPQGGNPQGGFNNGPVYYQPAPPQEDPDKCVMTTGQWIITLLILCIPCVSIIMLFVWGFGEGNENRKNFARASLIFAAIAFVLTIIVYAVLGVAFFRGILDAQTFSSMFM